MVHIGVAFDIKDSVQSGKQINLDAELDKQMEKAIELNARVYEKSASYSNVMMLAGYAGIFAIWTFVKTDLSPRATEVVALLLGMSLIIYVTFELYAMFMRAQPLSEVAKQTSAKPTDFFAAMQNIEMRQNRRALHAAIVWRVTFWPAVVLGYASALLLSYNLIAGLLHWSFWPA